MSDRGLPLPAVALAALFVASLVTGQLLAVKVLALPAPVAVPFAGTTLLVPAGVVAYALTFFASDCYAELYGKRSAQAVVNVGFLTNFVWLGLLYAAVSLPGSRAGVDPDAFASVLAPSANVVVGSLLAYAVKLLIAVVDTPLVYAAVRTARGRAGTAGG